MAVQQLKTYARRIRDLLRANPNTPETGLAPAFQELVADLLGELVPDPQLTVSPEYLHEGAGRPDIALIRPGQPPRAFIELKAPAKPGDPNKWRDAHDRRQFGRLKELAHWAASNFSEFHLFHRDQLFGWATVVPASALHPFCDDAAADRLVESHDPGPLLELLTVLCRADAPAARNAEHLAELMAHSARLVRGIVQELLAELNAQGPADHPLLQVRTTFRDVLYAHPEAGGYSARDFDTLFSAAFAQTLAFGLLLVREATGEPVGDNAHEHMPDEHPLMKNALYVLTLPQVAADLGIGLTIMRDTVNSFAPEILAQEPGGRDPILYFYEDFLATFDPVARERYGVYYTPIEVVRYMSAALDRALRELGTQGLADPQVTILDPATGTGTFLLGVAERVRAQVVETEGPFAAAAAIGDLAGRLYGFELLIGPYAVAHFRLRHALAQPILNGDEEPVAVELPRLGVYLADTLAAPNAAAPAGPLGFIAQGIQDERREANRIKVEQPILAIIGNPPYRRLLEGENETLVGRWMDEQWDDLKAPVREAGKGNQLNTFPELSVAFWRWAIWKLFEADNAPRRGVVAFITNRKFLTGWPYAGLRQRMRERFDRIEIIDLRGDVRRGERGDVDSDQGVFNIKVGTAITVAIADGSKAAGELAEVGYVDSWEEGRFSRSSKFAFLAEATPAGRPLRSTAVHNDALGNFRPAPFQNGNWTSLREAFIYAVGGMQTKRNDFVYAPRRNILLERIRSFHSAPASAARHLFRETRDRKAAVAHAQLLNETLIVQTAYRPLDRRFLYRHPAFGDFLRPALKEAWGEENVALYSHPSAVTAGPAAWCHGFLPDYDSFRGSYGGYAFLLYDRREGPEATNLSAALIAGLSANYGVPVTPEQLFAAILCLLSAASYSHRFAEDLEDVFPHIPFPADHAVFEEAVRIGGEIRAVETFARQPEVRFRPPTLVRQASHLSGNAIGPVTYADGEITLCADGSGHLTGIPEPVWEFAVSGYRVLPRWIEGRTGLPADLAFVRELRDAAARIAELIHRFDEADLVLEATLADTLTREELGFAAAEGAAADEEADGEHDD
jgi:hypothetical protein